MRRNYVEPVHGAALESLLVEKGLVEPAAIDAIVDAFETKIGPRNGKAVVVKAWTDLLDESAQGAVASGLPQHMATPSNFPLRSVAGRSPSR